MAAVNNFGIGPNAVKRFKIPKESGESREDKGDREGISHIHPIP